MCWAATSMQGPPSRALACPSTPAQAGSWAQPQPGQWLPPGAALRLRLVQVATSSQPLTNHQHKLFPAVFRGAESKHAAPYPVHGCRDLRLCSLWLQPSFLRSCGLLLALGWESSPCHGHAGGSAASSGPPYSLAPVPAIESQSGGDPRLCPHLRAIPARCRVTLAEEWDMAAALLGLAPCPIPPATLAPGQPLGEGEGRGRAIPTSTLGWHRRVPGLCGEQGEMGLYLFR